ncbi:radical SAM family heme chaperone HemW [Alicyclobacillus shizuokensis]|uniref:radical SAM family heme chaperone HemW n=1 Tax=Alicyclobacillus shizuokensis TaxID=392014 RepID=UPI000836F2FB|nr:radical SAM family heme chaperone HemW [Alicyclobacillus shizuokensis]MBX6351852.1 radical SAM family heme chaperone HemW [Thermoflavifilum sp.]MCL6512935.1 radical SAM family heme chaperone HemW [Alicyclobacillus sp.]
MTDTRSGVGPHRQPPAASLYVHIPFCASRCFYCDFTTYVAPASARQSYLEALSKELALLAAEVRTPLETVFFGGGTPTLLDSRQWDQLLTGLRRVLPIADNAEITVEANPETVDVEKLRVLAGHGVNRLSFGAQTLNDRLLLAIGRLHDADTVLRSIDQAQRAGFSRINVDLMFGLPDQSMADVEASLRTMADLGVEHLSAYWLKVEAGTPFADWLDQGRLNLPGEDLEAQMYERVREYLTAQGYVHYEISNFAKPGGEARHNLVYWRNYPYLAAGVGAHGYVGGVRYENVRNLAAYNQMLAEGRRPIQESQAVSAQEAAEDTMMLGLRLAEGVADARFRRQHGCGIRDAFGPVVQRLVDLELVEWQGGSLRLTHQAWPVANLAFAPFVGTLTAASV